MRYQGSLVATHGRQVPRHDHPWSCLMPVYTEFAGGHDVRSILYSNSIAKLEAYCPLPVTLYASFLHHFSFQDDALQE